MAPTKPSPTSPPPPHILLVVADDLGLHDVGYNGSPIPTPTLDSLSSKGVRLNQYYVHPTCSPTRAALMTGRYSHNVGITGALLGSVPLGLDRPGQQTIASALRRRGYHSSMVGKWHLGHAKRHLTPTGVGGFDDFVGVFSGATGHYSKYLYAGPLGADRGGYDLVRDRGPSHDLEFFLDERHSTDTFVDEAQQAIVRHAQSSQYRDEEQPLFLYLAFTAPHSPLQATEEALAKCEHIPHHWRRAFCGMVVGVDAGVASVVETARRELGDNIVVVFSTDNGGEPWVGGINEPLRGIKYTSWEGGSRGVGFVTDLSANGGHYLPGAGGSVYEGLFHASDWYPSLVCGLVDPLLGDDDYDADDLGEIDGLNLVPALLDTTSAAVERREEVVYNIDDIDKQYAFRRGRFKLIVGEPGDGKHYTEPGDWIAGDKPTHGEMALELTMGGMERLMGRDRAFFWKEIVRVVFHKFTTRNEPKPDVMLFDLEADPYETTDLAETQPEVLVDMIRRFDAIRANAEPQRNWRLGLVKDVQPLQDPQVCAGRTSHLGATLESWSIDASVPCRFHGPWLDDDVDLSVLPTVDISEVFKGEMRRQIRLLLLCGVALFLLLLVRCVRGGGGRRKKKEKGD